MKTFIASLREWENYEIAHNAARAPYFIVFEDNKYIETIKNPFTTWGGAWFAVAELLKEKWCNKFIAGKIWNNLKNMLQQYNIEFEEKN